MQRRVVLWLEDTEAMPTLFEKLPVDATMFADGGSRGNPGPSASGAVLFGPDGSILREVGEFLGIKTNNVAEWTALIIGLRAAQELGLRTLAIRMDSELVVKQVRGEYRVKNEDLKPLHQVAMRLLKSFDRIDIAHVPRNQNKDADRVVNRVLDAIAQSQRENAV